MMKSNIFWAIPEISGAAPEHLPDSVEESELATRKIKFESLNPFYTYGFIMQLDNDRQGIASSYHLSRSL